MSNALDRINQLYRDCVTYAGVCSASRNKHWMCPIGVENQFRHTPLEDDADDYLLHLQELGWLYVKVMIQATTIPGHTIAVFSIKELLAGRGPSLAMPE